MDVKFSAACRESEDAVPDDESTVCWLKQQACAANTSKPVILQQKRLHDVPVHDFCQAGLVGHDLGQVLVHLGRLIAHALILCITHYALHRRPEILLPQQAQRLHSDAAWTPPCCLTCVAPICHTLP